MFYLFCNYGRSENILSTKDYKGNTPLHLICENGNSDLLSITFSYLIYSKILFYFSQSNIQLLTTVGLAILRNHFLIIKYLFDHLSDSQLESVFIEGTSTEPLILC